ncbi:malonyl-ACP O-methyltransferase BioC [Motilimonas eburnea]|uniref:malonyl-ACP O-methyltransferase BioC n=1 Tax=Motilimonas eburnea TaxID=1737488 RepID=UPI001E643DC6|nr:malonyl-ACP O-methyltransferase BioC [Motilimonas eburnea]MCE2570060.1 malonyl-ACP O-methyltransferase BioC [Motilimonas eburnea]
MSYSPKSSIAQAFSKAAASYDSAAQFQRDTGHKLLDPVLSRANVEPLASQRWLDLGSGTGYFTELLAASGAHVVGLDLALGMLSHAKAQRSSQGSKQLSHPLTWVNGDAESLPLQDNAFDLVFSTLALQWCDDLGRALQEAHRVLKPQGEMYFTTLVAGSLTELTQAWQQVDDKHHVNAFLSQAEIAAAVCQADFSHVELQVLPEVVSYPNALALLRDLKGIGANHVPTRAHAAGLGGRGALAAMCQAYESFRNDHGMLPATYQVCYAKLIK